MSTAHSEPAGAAARTGPDQRFAAYASSDVLATDDPDGEPHRARWAVVALAGALVLALVGGVS